MDPRKTFVCRRCGYVINDADRPQGKDTPCPGCENRELEKRMANRGKNMRWEDKQEQQKSKPVSREVRRLHGWVGLAVLIAALFWVTKSWDTKTVIGLIGQVTAGYWVGVWVENKGGRA